MTTLGDLLRDRARDLTRHLAAARRGDVRGVHQGRVASRRLRESLPSLARARTAALLEARKTFRRVTRALGPVRELDVTLGLLDRIGAVTSPLHGARIPRAAVARVRAHVEAERERRRARMLTRLERTDVAGAVAQIERLAEMPAATPTLTPARAHALTARVRARAASLSLAVDRAGTLYDPDRLHAVRIATKKLRYAVEVAVATGQLDGDQMLTRLKRVQQRLGVMHDYQILLEHVAAVRDQTPPGARTAAGLRRLADSYDRACRELHAEYLRLAPDLAATSGTLRTLGLKVRKTRR